MKKPPTVFFSRLLPEPLVVSTVGPLFGNSLFPHFQMGIVVHHPFCAIEGPFLNSVAPPVAQGTTRVRFYYLFPSPS